MEAARVKLPDDYGDLFDVKRRKGKKKKEIESEIPGGGAVLNETLKEKLISGNLWKQKMMMVIRVRVRSLGVGGARSRCASFVLMVLVVRGCKRRHSHKSGLNVKELEMAGQIQSTQGFYWVPPPPTTKNMRMSQYLINVGGERAGTEP